jgi:glycosyltransferase involved in cell wall biosynthesis
MSEKIKLVHILPSLDRGGAEKIVVDLLCRLDRDKFAPELILFRHGGFWEKKLAENNIPVTILEKRHFFDWRNFRPLLQALRAIQPVIVHTHLGGDIYGRLAARLLKVPIIITTEHNVNYHEPTYLSLVKRWTATWVDKIIAVSQAVRSDMNVRYRLKAERTAVIYNGLDFQEFYQNRLLAAKKGLKGGKPLIIGTMGRLSPQKGHLSLIEAARIAKSRNWLIKIAGRGEQEAILKKAIKSAGLEENIQLVGTVDRPAEFLKSLDIFIFPSLWEGLGIAVLEAAASGLPIIASRADGLREILDDTNSLGFPPGDAVALAAQIDWLSGHYYEPSVQEKALAAQELVRQKFSLEESVRAYEKIYEQLWQTFIKSSQAKEII